jgi:DNA replication protein DnaC
MATQVAESLAAILRRSSPIGTSGPASPTKSTDQSSTTAPDSSERTQETPMVVRARLDDIVANIREREGRELTPAEHDFLGRHLNYEEARKAVPEAEATLLAISGVALMPAQTFEDWRRCGNPKCDVAMGMAYAWAQDRGAPFLTLSGAPGLGKSHLARAAVRAVVARKILGIYHTLPGLVDEVKRQFDASTAGPWLEQLKRATVLVLDDLGREHVTPYTRSLVHDVIDYRYERWMRTLIVTNCTPDQLASPDLYGPAVVSRLRDTRRSQYVVMVGDDYRTLPEARR